MQGGSKVAQNQSLLIVQNMSQQSRLQTKMSSDHDQTNSRKKYSKISLKKRQNLIQLVIRKKESLTKTAKRLNIKLSTAKLILRKYRKTGVLFNKKMSGRPPKVENNSDERVQNAQQSNICKIQSHMSPEQNVKQQEEVQAHPSQQLIIPTAYHPTFHPTSPPFVWWNYLLHM